METPSPLEQLRRRLALAVGENAVFDGWTRQAVDSAAGQLGIDSVQARLAFRLRLENTLLAEVCQPSQGVVG